MSQAYISDRMSLAHLTFVISKDCAVLYVSYHLCQFLSLDSGTPEGAAVSSVDLVCLCYRD